MWLEESTKARAVHESLYTDPFPQKPRSALCSGMTATLELPFFPFLFFSFPFFSFLSLLCYFGENTFHEIYPLNEILSVQYSIVHYRSLELTHFAETLYPLNSHSPFSPPSSPGSPHSALFLWFPPCSIPAIRGIMQYLSFHGGLISLSRVSWRFVHGVQCVRMPFFF